MLIAANLGTLFIYKYLDFAIGNINGIFGKAIELPGIALPIGISFYCFQCISYIVDVYRGDVTAQRSIKKLALYILFFPQLIAGPIVRYIDIYREIEDRDIRYANVFAGLQRFAIGLAKKVLIADVMGYMADQVFAVPAGDLSTAWAWIGILCYGLEIYYDFSAYSDMAIGLGLVFNFRFNENFLFPYNAHSIQDFWRRWHISLSTWLRDYLYIPLGGSRISNIRTLFNVWIVFLLCGLWHGAAWTFVVWGAWHGLGLTLERLGLENMLKKLPFFLSNLYVWLFVSVSWVFFRAPDLPYATAYLRAMFTYTNVRFWEVSNACNAISISSVLVAWVAMVFAYARPNGFFAARKERVWAIGLTGLLFFVAYVFAVTSSFSPFLYFRF